MEGRRVRAFAFRSEEKGLLRSRRRLVDKACSAASKSAAAASGCGGAGPSPALPLLDDAPRHRLCRGALDSTPRRSQRRATPFFSSLLGASSGCGGAFARELAQHERKNAAVPVV